MITWGPDYELGIESIDEQHHKIVDYINELFCVTKDSSSSQVDRILSDLVDYTFFHFDYEESLLEEVDFEDLMLHKLTHDTFRKQINSFKSRHDAGESITEELAEMLQTWLVEHILSDDADYVASLKEQLKL